MNLTPLKNRQIRILELLRKKSGLSAPSIQEELGDISLITIKREMSALVKRGLVTSSGPGRTSGYSLDNLGELLVPVNLGEYFKEEIDKRGGFERFDPKLIPSIPSTLLSEGELRLLEEETNKFRKRSKEVSDIIAQKEMERFVIEFSWKSSKIEGNTYSLLETEKLIQSGIDATGHTHEESQMILNHKKALEFILEHKNEFKGDIKQSTIEEIHRILVEDLHVGQGLRKQAVGILGTVYKPPDNEYQVREALDDLRSKLSEITDPYTRSLIGLLGISYIQPFEDGNKRTARLLANAILLASDHAPLSYRNADENRYRESTIIFYETHSAVSFKDMFLGQYLFAARGYGLKV